MRTYSRIKENGKNERWWETVQRVVEGTYTMQKNWIESHQLGWNNLFQKAHMKDIFTMKFLPRHGRFCGKWDSHHRRKGTLWKGKQTIVPFVSTKTLRDDYSKPFVSLWMHVC